MIGASTLTAKPSLSASNRVSYLCPGVEPRPHPEGPWVISAAGKCLYSLLFLVVEHLCRVPAAGRKEGEISECRLPHLQQGRRLKERKSKLSASALSPILDVHLLKPTANCAGGLATLSCSHGAMPARDGALQTPPLESAVLWAFKT